MSRETKESTKPWQMFWSQAKSFAVKIDNRIDIFQGKRELGGKMFLNNQGICLPIIRTIKSWKRPYTSRYQQLKCRENGGTA